MKHIGNWKIRVLAVCFKTIQNPQSLQNAAFLICETHGCDSLLYTVSLETHLIYMCVCV